MVMCGSAEVALMGAFGIAEGQTDMERSGKNSRKKPPFRTGELDTIPALHLWVRKMWVCIC